MERMRSIVVVLLASSLACSCAPKPGGPGQPEKKSELGSPQPRDKMYHPKKGFPLTLRHGDRAKRITDLNASWHYTWGDRMPKEVPGAEFVPMVWGYWSPKPEFLGRIDKLTEQRKAGKRKHLLGWNEPDNKDQANMSVDKAIEGWQYLERTGLRLGAPGAVHALGGWMRKFMNKAKQKKLRIDFVPIHWYSGLDARGFLNHLRNIHETYGKPIWVTEFAPVDWGAKKRKEGNRFTEDQVLAFMKEVLTGMDRMDFVERYCWYAPHRGFNKSPYGMTALLKKDGTFTKLGAYYASHKYNPGPKGPGKGGDGQTGGKSTTLVFQQGNLSIAGKVVDDAYETPTCFLQEAAPAKSNSDAVGCGNKWVKGKAPYAGPGLQTRTLLAFDLSRLVDMLSAGKAQVRSVSLSMHCRGQGPKAMTHQLCQTQPFSVNATWANPSGDGDGSDETAGGKIGAEVSKVWIGKKGKGQQTWWSSPEFISAVNKAIKRPEMTLHLMLKEKWQANEDACGRHEPPSCEEVEKRPKLVIKVGQGAGQGAGEPEAAEKPVKGGLFSFRQGDLRVGGKVVDEKYVTPNFFLEEAAPEKSTNHPLASGNKWAKDGGPGKNGAQNRSLIAFDLTKLAEKLASGSQSVKKASLVMRCTSQGAKAMTHQLLETEPFASGASWNNPTGGDKSAEEPGGKEKMALAQKWIKKNGGGEKTWGPTKEFVAAVNNALQRPDKTLYLLLKGKWSSNEDSFGMFRPPAFEKVEERPVLIVEIE